MSRMSGLSIGRGLDPREWVAWFAFMAPKGTPAETLDFIKAERADLGAIAKAGKISV